MKSYKKYFIYGGFAVWFIMIVAIILYVFFPYQKMMKIVFQNFLAGNRVIVSIEGAKVGPLGAKASKVTFGHEMIQGKPLFEIERASINWRFFPIFKGVIDVVSTAVIYNGNMKMYIANLPFIANSTPVVTIKLDNVMLSNYPEGRLPWFKGLSGTMTGWIKKEMPLYAPEKQKGTLALNLLNGEIKELAPKNFPKFTIPYKNIAIEGKISGDKITFNKLLLESPNGDIVKGGGYLDTNEFDPKVDLSLFYESKSEGSPLPGKGKINISGNKWILDVTILPESQSVDGNVKTMPQNNKTVE
jgi:type II secretion system protein N